MKRTTILLVDDHAIVRQGMHAVLACESDLEVLAEAENGRDAVQLARQNQPEVVVMDLAMPLMNGIEATRQILKSCPSIKVLIVSSYADNKCITEALEAGALGYLDKLTAGVELATAIREVRRGNPFFSTSISKLRSLPHSHRSQELTSRQAQVLQLIADGYSNKEMAAELGISVKTVEKHRQTVMNKLNLHETAGLTRYAISQGLVMKS